MRHEMMTRRELTRSHQQLMITVMDMVTSYVIVVYCNETHHLPHLHPSNTTQPTNFLFSTLLILVWTQMEIINGTVASGPVSASPGQWCHSPPTLLHPQHKLMLIDTLPNVSIEEKPHKKCPHIKTDTFRTFMLVIIGL